MERTEGPRLALEVSGAHGGTPVLLLRPPGGSVVMWGAFRAALAARLRVIAFDRSGEGESDDPPRFVSTRGMGREALAVLDGLGVRRAHVFGVSLGGMAATWLAIDAPERVARVCLASTPDTGLDLRRVRAPVLVLAGERDELIGAAPQLALARGIPWATLETVRGAGHDITLESPLAVAERVLRFFFDEEAKTLRDRTR